MKDQLAVAKERDKLAYEAKQSKNRTSPEATSLQKSINAEKLAVANLKQRKMTLEAELQKLVR